MTIWHKKSPLHDKRLIKYEKTTDKTVNRNADYTKQAAANIIVKNNSALSVALLSALNLNVFILCVLVGTSTLYRS